jgi:hypothetical protein
VSKLETCDAVILIDVLAAAVRRPCASTVKVATCDADPYEAAVTAVLSRLIVTVALEALEVKPVPPEIVKLFVVGVAVPLSPAMDVGTAPVTAIVIDPAPLVIEIPVLLVRVAFVRVFPVVLPISSWPFV